MHNSFFHSPAALPTFAVCAVCFDRAATHPGVLSQSVRPPTMSLAFVAPSSATTTAKQPSDVPTKGINRAQTFACCPPLSGIKRTNTQTSQSTATKTSRSPTFARPRRTRTGIVHFAPQPGGPYHKGLIISGYTCIGKTSFGVKVSLKNKHTLRVVDLDSSEFSRKPGFPENYLEAIRRQAEDGRSIVLISTHDPVAARLEEEGYYVALVYPEGSPTNKAEWLRRLAEREKDGRQSRLYKLVDQYWDVWHQHLLKCPVSKKVALSDRDYLISVFREIYKDYFLRVVMS